MNKNKSHIPFAIRTVFQGKEIEMPFTPRVGDLRPAFAQ